MVKKTMNPVVKMPENFVKRVTDRIFGYSIQNSKDIVVES